MRAFGRWHRVFAAAFYARNSVDREDHRQFLSRQIDLAASKTLLRTAEKKSDDEQDPEHEMRLPKGPYGTYRPGITLA